MISAYHVSVGDLAKNAHHEAMADIHADRGIHYRAKKESVPRPDFQHVSEAGDTESRRYNFYGAAVAHHTQESHEHATEAMQKPNSRRFDFSFKENMSNPGVSDSSRKGEEDVYPSRRRPKVTDHPITGEPQTFIPDYKLQNKRLKSYGLDEKLTEKKDTANSPHLRGKRFL